MGVNVDSCSTQSCDIFRWSLVGGWGGGGHVVLALGNGSGSPQSGDVSGGQVVPCLEVRWYRNRSGSPWSRGEGKVQVVYDLGVYGQMIQGQTNSPREVNSPGGSTIWRYVSTVQGVNRPRLRGWSTTPSPQQVEWKAMVGMAS